MAAFLYSRKKIKIYINFYMKLILHGATFHLLKF